MAKIKFGGVDENVVTREEFTLEHAREVLNLNLKDNGFNVIVGQRKGKTYDKAVADGWVPGVNLFEIEEACEKGTIIQFLVSDAAQIAIWPTVKKHLTAGKALYFSHGFGITYKERTGIIPPADVDVIMVAPKGSGTSLRRLFLQGRGVNSSYAVYQDATGRALDRTLALGIGVGSGYLFETDFKREVYSDLTGERGTLMGAIQGILSAQYEVLREHGHSPSEAFNETVEEGHGLDVRQLLHHRPARRAGLDGPVPRCDQARVREAVPAGGQRRGSPGLHRRELQAGLPRRPGEGTEGAPRERTLAHRRRRP